MAKSPKLVAEELGDVLRSSGEKLVTMTWPQFYDVNDMVRMMDSRYDRLREECRGQGILIAFGSHAIAITHDSNHSPAE